MATGLMFTWNLADILDDGHEHTFGHEAKKIRSKRFFAVIDRDKVENDNEIMLNICLEGGLCNSLHKCSHFSPEHSDYKRSKSVKIFVNVSRASNTDSQQ